MAVVQMQAAVQVIYSDYSLRCLRAGSTAANGP